MTSADVEALALEAHALANLPLWFPTAAELAQALGIVMLPLPEPLVDLVVTATKYDDVEVIYRGPSADERSLFWGLAWTLLNRDGRVFTRAEADHLALALAIPADRADRAQYFAQHLPADDVARRVAQLGAAR